MEHDSAAAINRTPKLLGHKDMISGGEEEEDEGTVVMGGSGLLPDKFHKADDGGSEAKQEQEMLENEG